MYKELSEILVDLRKSRKLTQVELGKEIGVTNKTISKWENGVFLPDITYLVVIANFYNITVDELLKGTMFQPENVKMRTLKEKKKKNYHSIMSLCLTLLLTLDSVLLILNSEMALLSTPIVITLSLINALFIGNEVLYAIKKVISKRKNENNSSVKKTIKL